MRGLKEDGKRCSLVYKKKLLSDEACPVCKSYASTDLYKEKDAERRIDKTIINSRSKTIAFILHISIDWCNRI